VNEQIIVPDLVSSDGPTPLKIEVTVHGRQAVLHMSEPREYLAMTGPEPIQLGARMMTAAVEADPAMAQPAIAGAMAVIDAIYSIKGDIKPAGGAVKHELIERHRATLTNRLNVVLNSTRETRVISNLALAKQLVDISLSEIFS
jgi:hypothetical protein